MKSRFILALASVIAAGSLIGGFFYFRADQSEVLDTQLQAALQAVQSHRMYEATVETATALSDRSIVVFGLYRLDFERNRFGTYATTTLTIPRNKATERTHNFTFRNLSIENDIYVHIDTQSALLRKTIPYGPEWHHFSADAVPAQFKDIAVFGPVLDNLALLAKNGAYLSLSGEPSERMYGGELFRVYSFKLSEKAASASGGTLQSLIRRIGTGDVHIWLDTTPRVRLMTFRGDNYVSTTTILGVNSAVEIEAPVSTE